MNRLKTGFQEKKIGIPEDAFVIGQVGRISKRKSPGIFIRAATKIKESISNAYFVLVGDGDMKDEILQYAEENGLTGSLKITGWVGNPPSYATTFDTAVLLSRWEGFGLVLPEYMLAQKPIVACESDAVPILIDNRVKTVCLYRLSRRRPFVMLLWNFIMILSLKHSLLKTGKSSI